MGRESCIDQRVLNSTSVLIARRAPGKKHAGSWEFPGGKVEIRESPEECLKRELFEEFGVEALIKQFISECIYEYPAGEIRLLAYSTEIIAGEIKLRVHDSIEWVNIVSKNNTKRGR